MQLFGIVGMYHVWAAVLSMMAQRILQLRSCTHVHCACSGVVLELCN